MPIKRVKHAAEIPELSALIQHQYVLATKLFHWTLTIGHVKDILKDGFLRPTSRGRITEYFPRRWASLTLDVTAYGGLFLFVFSKKALERKNDLRPVIYVKPNQPAPKIHAAYAEEWEVAAIGGLSFSEQDILGIYVYEPALRNAYVGQRRTLLPQLEKTMHQLGIQRIKNRQDLLKLQNPGFRGKPGFPLVEKYKGDEEYESFAFL